MHLVTLLPVIITQKFDKIGNPHPRDNAISYCVS
jgi:hypothetical protein